MQVCQIQHWMDRSGRGPGGEKTHCKLDICRAERLRDVEVYSDVLIIVLQKIHEISFAI